MAFRHGDSRTMNAISSPTWVLAGTWLLAALSLWLPPRERASQAWMPCLALALVTGLAVGALRPPGAATVFVLAMLCIGWRRAQGRVVRGVLLAATGSCANR